MSTQWFPGDTAPRDGSDFWAYLYQSGIRKCRWYTAEELAEVWESDDPDRFDPGFGESDDPNEDWSPKWWLPLDALPDTSNL